MQDLGRWAGGGYRVPGELVDETGDEDEAERQKEKGES
jgi:endogenous inhibitor of DNA gyrase (YacG/DUF329 family)